MCVCVCLFLDTVQANSSSTQSDSKKTYQGIKFLVGLANRYLMQSEVLVYLSYFLIDAH